MTTTQKGKVVQVVQANPYYCTRGRFLEWRLRGNNKEQLGPLGPAGHPDPPPESPPPLAAPPALAKTEHNDSVVITSRGTSLTGRFIECESIPSAKPMDPLYSGEMNGTVPGTWTRDGWRMAMQDNLTRTTDSLMQKRIREELRAIVPPPDPLAAMVRKYGRHVFKAEPEERAAIMGIEAEQERAENHLQF